MIFSTKSTSRIYVYFLLTARQGKGQWGKIAHEQGTRSLDKTPGKYFISFGILGAINRSRWVSACNWRTNLVPRVPLLCLLSRWNRDPGCGWSRDYLSTQNRRVGGYSSTFGREDDKIPPCYPTLPAYFSTTQILGGHVTSRNQGLCSND